MEYLECQRKAKREWKKRNRDRVNTYRRQKRMEKRKELLAERKCRNCTILLKERWSKGIRLYCAGCIKDYQYELKRIQRGKIKVLPTVGTSNISWRRAKETKGITQPA